MNSGLIIVRPLLLVVVIFSCASCHMLEYREYSIVTKDYDWFKAVVRLDGTLYFHSKKAVAAPYKLFISVTPKKDIGIRISNLSLEDGNKQRVLEEAQPFVSIELVSSNFPLGFYCVDKPSLEIEYVDYRLRFEVLVGDKEDVVPEKVDVILKRQYYEKLTSYWWEAASGI
jgi:hypothetical protein